MAYRGCSTNYSVQWKQNTFKRSVCYAFNKIDNGLQRNTSLLVLAAVKTNTLVIEREVKEKFALSTLNTSGWWWVISLTRTFSLATNWLRRNKNLLLHDTANLNFKFNTIFFYPIIANFLVLAMSRNICYRQHLLCLINLLFQRKIDLRST